jgi:hypothetical protein
MNVKIGTEARYSFSGNIFSNFRHFVFAVWYCIPLCGEEKHVACNFVEHFLLVKEKVFLVITFLLVSSFMFS